MANTTALETIETKAPFPLTTVAREFRDYLGATEQVQSDHPRIRSLAGELTKGVATEFDAVQRLISWVVDHVSYVSPPLQYDAVYALESGKGNCQNFSHLSAALLRASGIPVRIINGITLNRPLDVAWQQGVMTLKMGQGRHSWIEVWFPDLGWVPFDPQNSVLFVSSRFIRVEVGVDNNETKNDGLLTWTQARDTAGKPRLQEAVNADFRKDEVRIRGNGRPTAPGTSSSARRSGHRSSRLRSNPFRPCPCTPRPRGAPSVLMLPFSTATLRFPKMSILPSRG